jgi:hypothetical protein
MIRTLSSQSRSQSPVPANDSFASQGNHGLGMVGATNTSANNLSTVLKQHCMTGADVDEVIHAAANFLDAINVCDAANREAGASIDATRSHTPVRSQSPGLLQRVKARFLKPSSPATPDDNSGSDPRAAASENLSTAVTKLRTLLKPTFNELTQDYESPIVTADLQKIAFEILQAADRDGVTPPEVRTPAQDDLPRTVENKLDSIVRVLSSNMRLMFSDMDGKGDNYSAHQFNLDYIRSGKGSRHYFGNNQFAKDCIQFHPDGTTPKLPDPVTYEDVLRVLLVQQQFELQGCAKNPSISFPTGSFDNRTCFFGNSYMQGDAIEINCRVVFAEKSVDTSRFKEFNPDGTLKIPKEYENKSIGCLEYTYVFDRSKLDEIKLHLERPQFNDKNYLMQKVGTGAIRTVKVSAMEMHNVSELDPKTYEPIGELFDIPRTELGTCQFTSRAFASSRSPSRSTTPANQSFARPGGAITPPEFHLDPTIPPQTLERRGTLAPSQIPPKKPSEDDI